MPGGDRTGPAGLGPRTGRAAGYCEGNPNPGYMNPGPGFGRGFGRGGGRGFGRGCWGRGRGFSWRGYNPEPYYQPAPNYPEPTKEEEKSYLENILKRLEEEIKSIKDRIQELSKEKKEAQ